MMGMAHAGECRANPRGAVDANVVALVNVLEACRAAGIRRMAFPSSAHVYRLPAPMPIDEDAPTAARSMYAATKIASETMLQGYAADFGFSCAVGRLGNVYGNGASEDSVASIVLREVAVGRQARPNVTSRITNCLSVGRIKPLFICYYMDFF